VDENALIFRTPRNAFPDIRDVRLHARTGAAQPGQRRGAYHRSARRQSLEEELQGAAFDGTARHVWCFSGNELEAVWALAPAASGTRHAVLPSARADERMEERRNIGKVVLTT
jgi:hypothetical protein